MPSLQEILARKNTVVVPSTNSLKDLLNAKKLNQGANVLTNENNAPNERIIQSSPIHSAPYINQVDSEVLKATINKEYNKLSLKERLELKKQTEQHIREEYAERLAEEKANANLTIPAIPDVKLQTNVLSNVKESLKERLERMKKLEALDKAVEEIDKATETAEVVKVTHVDQTVAMHKPTMAELLAQKKATAPATHNNATILNDEGKINNPSYTDSHTFSLDIQLNDKQQSAVEFIATGNSFVLLGAAGTGKTTSERGMCHKILEAPTLKTSSFKVSSQERIDAPSVAIVAFTRRASSNSAKAILKDPVLAASLSRNIMTIHALLEFEPVSYYDDDGKECFRFVPMRDASNPLTLTHLIIEESTLVGLDLWQQLFDALPSGVQIILVGDINQLPPVFGPSILNYALVQLPCIELTQVYRQAEGSPIIDNAHNILSGKPLVPKTNTQGKLAIISGKQPYSVGQHKTALTLSVLFKQFYDMGMYNPDEDMLITPYNEQDLGSNAMNYHIAELLSKGTEKVVYEVIVGFAKRYFAVGDKVMYNKRDAVIVKIAPNPAYIGKQPQECGTDLSRWGVRRLGEGNDVDLDEVVEDDYRDIDYSNFDIDKLAEDRERKMQSSHIITIAYEEGNTLSLQAAGDLGDKVFSLGYAITCHKAQGSEWKRVFIILHKDQLRNLSREWLYTAVTRAREEVYLIAKEDIINKTIATQRVKGNTLKDKIEYFNSGVMEVGKVQITKP